MATLVSQITEISKSGRSVLADFLSFLARPNIAASRAPTITSRLVLVIWLLAISFAVTAFFAILAIPVVMFSEVAVGDKLAGVLDRPALSMLVALVFLGPLLEEMMFRGWLTGTYRSVVATATFLGVLYGGAHLLEILSNKPPEEGALVVIAVLAFLLFLAIERTRNPARPDFYGKVFPYIFWLQGIVFGSLHFANAEGSSFILPLLVTMPLIICGWLFAYARIVAGFGSVWLLHGLYNVPPALAAILIPIFYSQ